MARRYADAEIRRCHFRMRVVCFDLDDTLYKEIDYLQSAYREIAAYAAGQCTGCSDSVGILAIKAYNRMLDAYHEGQNAFEELNRFLVFPWLFTRPNSTGRAGLWYLPACARSPASFLHLFSVQSVCQNSPAKTNPYLFFKKRVKSFGRKIKNHPAWRSE